MNGRAECGVWAVNTKKALDMDWLVFFLIFISIFIIFAVPCRLNLIHFGKNLNASSFLPLREWLRKILWKLFSWPKSRIKDAWEGSLLQSNYSDHNSSLPVITPTAPIQHMDGYARTQLACVWGNIIIIPSYNTMAFMHAPKNLNKTRMQFVRTKAIGPGQWGIQHNFEFYLNEMCE